MDDIKRCSRCLCEWPRTIEYYGRSSKTRDGFRPECKLCHADDDSADYYRNQFDILDKRRDGYHANLDAKRAYFREYRQRQRQTAKAA